MAGAVVCCAGAGAEDGVVVDDGRASFSPENQGCCNHSDCSHPKSMKCMSNPSAVRWPMENCSGALWAGTVVTDNSQ